MASDAQGHTLHLLHLQKDSQIAAVTIVKQVEAGDQHGRNCDRKWVSTVLYKVMLCAEKGPKHHYTEEQVLGVFVIYIYKQENYTCLPE